MTSRLNLLTTCFGIAIILAGSGVQAEVVSIDVTIKAIDAKDRSITVTKTTKSQSKDIELEVGKKAKVSLDGKEATLDSLKPGQKASISYESDLEVVTNIEVTDDGNTQSHDKAKTDSVVFKKTGCRVVWTILETGDSTLTISRPLENRATATDSLIRHDDGTVEFQYGLETEESATKAMLGKGENAEFNSRHKAILMTPKPLKGYSNKAAHFNYSKVATLPLTIEYEFDFVEPSGGFPFGLNVRNRRSGTEFPFLNIHSENDLKTSVHVHAVWHASKDDKGKSTLAPLVEDKSVDLNEPKEFKFTIPLKSDDFFIPEFGSIGSCHSILTYLSVRGRLRPLFGVGFDEKSKEPVTKNVIPNGLGDTIGMKSGDVVLSINGKKPLSVKDAMELLAKIQFGEESEITVKRSGKTVKLGFTAE